MQRAVTLLVFSLLVFAGCARHYKITLTDQNVITTRSRPKLDRVNNVYRFKDATGATVELPSIRVKEIEPL